MRLLSHLQSLVTEYSPRVHANGFIQIDITPAVRLHIWGDARIPKQKVPTPIHDHAFAFTSRVLVGSLTQREYVADRELSLIALPRGTLVCQPALPANALICQPHRAQIRRGEDTTLAPEGPAVIVLPRRAFDVSPESGRDTYSMAVGDLHETVPTEPSVSVIVKTGASLSQGGPSPLIMVPYGQTPSNEFDRHAALAFSRMWQIVADAVAVDPEAVATGIMWALGAEVRALSERLDDIRQDARENRLHE